MTFAASTHSARKPRPRRIAADEAHAWARNLRLGNPYAKLVLSMLTIYVNGEGSCFVSIAQLAEDCELAENTIRRRLTFLEQVGAIAKFSQWRDEHGRLNTDGRGRRTTDDIRLLINADAADIEARAAGNADQGDGQEAEDNDAGRGSRGEPLDQSESTSSPSLGVQQPSHCGEGLISEPEPEEKIPPYPPSGGHGPGSIDQEEASEATEVEGWNEFRAAFEADREPIVRVSIAKQLFAALSPEERRRVTRAAKGLIEWRSRQKKPHAKPSGQTFIREMDAWASWEKHTPADAPPPKQATLIEHGTEEFTALALVRAIAGLPARNPFDPVTFIGQLPAGASNLAALARVDEHTQIDRTGWLLLEKHEREFVAWSERIKEWIGHWPETQRFWLDEHDNIVPSHAQAYRAPRPPLPNGDADTRPVLPKSKDGLLVPPTPDGFPPPKNTTQQL